MFPIEGVKVLFTAIEFTRTIKEGRDKIHIVS
jgi:hypothetical protein